MNSSIICSSWEFDGREFSSFEHESNGIVIINEISNFFIAGSFLD
jgi:hypothetical protein